MVAASRARMVSPRLDPARARCVGPSYTATRVNQDVAVNVTRAEEGALLERARSGDFAAFELLVARSERRLYAVARHLVGAGDAEDVVQSALLAALEKLAGFRSEASFGTWLTRITTNAALKVLRSRRLRRGASSAEDDGAAVARPELIADWRDDPVRTVERHELRQVLDAAVEDLPEGQRLVFVLRDVAGLSVAEAAEVLGISPANVKVRLLRARLALRERLTRAFGDPETRRAPGHGHAHGPQAEPAEGRAHAPPGGSP